METITVKNRSELIRAVKEAGFVGPFELENIKQWAQEGGTELPADLEQIWSVVVKIGGAAADAKAAPDPNAERIAQLEAEVATKSLEVEAIKAKNPGKVPSSFASATKAAHEVETKAVTWRNLAEKKAYDRRAANRTGIGADKLKGQTVFDDSDKSEAFGAWLRSSAAGPHDYPQKSADHEILRKSMITTTNTLGGALVPDDFAAELISLKEVRGVARQVLGTIPMSRDTLTYPRRTAGLTVYAPGETGTITASDLALNNVTLTANKLATLTGVSTELFNDSALSVSDLLAQEIAYAFADAEDKAFILGDQTSTYWGYLGLNGVWVNQATSNAPGTDAYQASVLQGSSATFSSLTITDFQKTVGLLPQYAAMDNPYWLMNRQYFYANPFRLMQALGGVTYAEGANGTRDPMFLGYPVKFTQVGTGTGAFSGAPATKTINCAFGSFRMGAKLGEVRGSMSIATSDQFYFNQDMVAIRGLERVALVVHDYGNYNSTAASRIPGPFVALATA